MIETQTLNASQEKAVTAVDGPCLILAGPGTGKTHTFAHRVAHLLKEKRISPNHILAVTFTRSAAFEMRERLKQLLTPSFADVTLPHLWIDTFHAIALRILRLEQYPFGPGVSFD